MYFEQLQGFLEGGKAWMRKFDLVFYVPHQFWSWDRMVGLAAVYELNGPGAQLVCTIRTGAVWCAWSGHAMALTTHPLLVSGLRRLDIPLPSVTAFAWYGMMFNFEFCVETMYIFLNSPLCRQSCHWAHVQCLLVLWLSHYYYHHHYYYDHYHYYYHHHHYFYYYYYYYYYWWWWSVIKVSVIFSFTPNLIISSLKKHSVLFCYSYPACITVNISSNICMLCYTINDISATCFSKEVLSSWNHL